MSFNSPETMAKLATITVEEANCWACAFYRRRLERTDEGDPRCMKHQIQAWRAGRERP